MWSEDDNFVIPYVHANVPIISAYDSKTTSKHHNAVPSVSKFHCELTFNVLCNAVIVFGPILFKPLDYRNNCILCLLWIHVVLFKPDLSVTLLKLESSFVVTNDDRGDRAVCLFDGKSLHHSLMLDLICLNKLGSEHSWLEMFVELSILPKPQDVIVFSNMSTVYPYIR